MSKFTRQDIGYRLEDVTGTQGYYHEFSGPGVSFNREPTVSHYAITPTEDGLVVAHTGWIVVPVAWRGRIYFRIIGNRESLTFVGPLAHSGAFFHKDDRGFEGACELSHPSDWKVTA